MENTPKARGKITHEELKALRRSGQLEWAAETSPLPSSVRLRPTVRSIPTTPGGPKPAFPSPRKRQAGFFSESPRVQGADALTPKTAEKVMPSSASLLPSARSFLPREVGPEPLASPRPALKVIDRSSSEALEPKVRLPFKKEPGQVPRRVEIERRRRVYQAVDIEGLFPTPKSQDGYLPLESFDDTEFDSRTDAEWLDMLKKTNRIPGKVYIEEIGWKDCYMTGINVEEKLWDVEVTGTKEKMQVPRIFLYLKAEDPHVFAERLKVALVARDKAESILRYNLYVDNMPHDPPPASFEEILHQIKSLAKNTPKLAEISDEELSHEILNDFARTMNKIVFDKSLVDPEQAAFFESLHIPAAVLDPEFEKPIQEKGKVMIPLHPFVEHYKEFSFQTFLIPEVIRTLHQIRSLCNDISDECMFHLESKTFAKKTFRYDEFEQVQTSTMNTLITQIKETWIHQLREVILSEMREVGKGWFNLSEQNRDVFEMSKLKKLMLTIRFMMQDSIQFLTERSILKFVEFIEKHMSYNITFEDGKIEQEHAFVTDRREKPVRPLFSNDIVEKDGIFQFSTPLERYWELVKGLFEKAVSMLSDVPDLEPHIMEQFFYKGTPPLRNISIADPYCQGLLKRLEETMKRANEPMLTYLKSFDQFRDLAVIVPSQYISEFEKSEHTLDESKQEVMKHRKMNKTVLDRIPFVIELGGYLVDMKTIRMQTSRKCDELGKLVLDMLARGARQRVREASKKYSDIASQVQRRPKNIEQLTEISKTISEVPRMVQEMESALHIIRDDYDLLEQFQYTILDDEFRAEWLALGWPKKLETIIVSTEKMLETERETFSEAMRGEQDTFTRELERLQKTVTGFHKHADLEKVHEVCAEVKHIQKHIKECEQKGKLFNQREALFSLEASEYDEISLISKEFEPYAVLWTSMSDWRNWHNAWMNDPFTSIDAEEMEKNTMNVWRGMLKSVKVFREQPKLLALADAVKKEVDEFKPNLPLVQALRQPGMRDRHWDQLKEKLGIEIRPGLAIHTLQDAFALGLPERTQEIQEIAEVAGKEYSIEVALDKMEKEWEGVQFDVVAYKETGTFVLRGSDDIYQLLDDHIVMTQSMGFSAYKKPFEDRIATWEYKLRLTSDVLEEWLNCQRQWLYLEPIFSSDDIMKQLPQEGKRFNTVDRTWRKIMAQVKATPDVMEFCTRTAKLRENFVESNKLLDMVQKGLNDYLETKRQAFARFYFLSNDELLEILSQTKEPKSVQPHLRKCFENIQKLEFQPDLEMTKMYSSEGEMVPFVNGIYPKGNVEFWLGEVEKMMRTSIRAQIEQSIHNYTKCPRNEWVLKWPGQVVLVGSQVYWCREVTEVLEREEEGALADYAKTLHRQLLGLTEIVRGDLTMLDRLTLGALITIDVHSRDVVQNMVASNVSKVTDFEWISQLRYSWDGELHVQQVESTFSYGYEYLGNTMRLVITPLTDRIYLTLTGALSMTLGGAPAGPAGTGKTETVKDLAKAFAKQCVVFNCQEGLDYLAMGKFFKGLAMSGAWACFDEFNRIDIEVLSVVAQQITTLQQAMMQGHKRIIFEGVDITLDSTFAVFITMNPGYAGRTELPDNLKALFRPVACMVPDYALIAEIRLFSFGFQDAKKLAQKMVATFRLSSEQLSSQDHYDFGMRAVNTVISAAGLLKSEEPDGNEELLLLRALRDSNLPKFLVDDIVLFNGIISDLFPGVKPPKIDYGILMKALVESTKQLGLQPTDSFLLKCIQLFETTVLRHGLMLVGPTGAGKTKCYETLSLAQDKVAGQNPKYDRIRHLICNPKSITMGQLYGQFDETTHEWTDGVLASLFRDCAQDTSGSRSYLIFDGPVDALWIESMNTVLDDNRKLCLVSGEIIPMGKKMNVIFEVEDLAVASPATVSRCGMVYLDPESTVGAASQIKSWVQRLDPNLASYLQTIKAMMDKYVAGSVRFVRHDLKEYVPTVDNNLVDSTFRIIDSFLYPYVPRKLEDYRPSAELMAGLEERLSKMIIFALVWAIGGSCDGASRLKFDKYIRKLIQENNPNDQFPGKGTVFDYHLDLDTISWIPWIDTLSNFKLDPKKKFSDIIVPTTDTIRYSWMVKHLATRGQNVLCVGPTGTGKTLTVMDTLMNSMDPTHLPIFVSFSAQTSANQTQDIIDGKMEKRRKGIYGPPAQHHYLLFIDDLNMPQRERYGAQPPIELIRQWMDHKGWYDRQKLEFRRIVDTSMIGAMGPPGGGRNPVTNRLLRHFNFLSFPEMEDESMFRIFHTILETFLTANHFADDITQMSKDLVEGSIDVFNTVRAELLPTPAKSHYTFNMRDLAKVVQGVMAAEARKVPGVSDAILLWIHECSRVFRDRLVDDNDRDWFDTLMKKESKSLFKTELSSILKTERILFCDFVHPDQRLYEQVLDTEKLKEVVDDFLDDYNNSSQGMNKPMKLVMFLDAMEHVCRISRVIRQPGGNALLLGVGGSGRQSLARLAAFIQEYELIQVEISKGYGVVEWHEDLKRLLLKAGLEDKNIVFLFCDTQLVKESFLEDINNILNSGEVPNIMDPPDVDDILMKMKPVCMAEGIPVTKVSMMARFVKRCQDNLHIVLAFSPVGNAFRNRLRKFPSLVNCCTIDWFSEWPEQALRSVAMFSFDGVQVALDDRDDTTLPKVVDMCVYMHKSVEKSSQRYFQVLSRYNYVTPTSYLELLTIFKMILGEKRTELATAKKRLIVGLDKLKSTETDVNKLKADLEEMQPVLLQTSQEVQEMMEQIEKDKEAADQTREVVVKEESDASAKADECSEIKADAQRDLDEALPLLDAAVESLKSLKLNDIREVGAYQSPPAGVKLVMESICIMKGVAPQMVGEAGRKKPDYWKPAVKLLGDPKGLLESFFTFDKDNIDEKIIKKIAKYVEDPNFVPEKVKTVSKACTSMCQWTHAMVKYHHVSRAVEPKRQRLAGAEKELNETMARLEDARARLKDVEERIADLEAKYDSAVKKKDELERKVNECEVKLDRAGRLIGGLGGEKIRWIQTVEDLGRREDAVIGDVLVASGGVAYIGPFTGAFRADIYEEWRKHLDKLELLHSEGVTSRNSLGDAVKIRDWSINGLPTDSLSIENAIVLDKSRRWPLMIDPQGQAHKWVKNTERENGLDILKLSDENLLRTMENAVRFGKPVLLENVLEVLPPSLEPILLRETFKQGGAEMIRLGDSVVPYHPDFRLYITTKLRNPHYSPETCVKVTLLNFFITRDGLEDQLLGIVVAKERPDLEEMKSQLVVSNAKMKKELKVIEDQILKLLSESSGDILEDEVLINTLAKSKVTSDEINEKVKEAEETEKEIDITRNRYRPVAFRASILFFCVADLALMDPMYQYSLQSFISLFVNGIENAEQSDVLETRLENLIDYFTYSLYQNICRSLFEEHKLLFSFMLCTRIMEGENDIDPVEWRFLLTGGTSTEAELPNPGRPWLNDKIWTEILDMGHLPSFKKLKFLEVFSSDIDQIKEVFDSTQAHRHKLPDALQDNMTDLQRLLFLRCLRPDKVTEGIQDFVTNHIGHKFIEPPTFDLAGSYKDSAPTIPLIFVLSPGADPAAELFRFADEMRFSKKLSAISLGQGQGPIAEKMIAEAMEKGTWVLLQNCHLAVSWMPSLERIVENFQPDKMHRDFRLWLTSMPSKAFPVSVLQNSVKMTNEPPKGLRANLLRSYAGFDDEFLNSCQSEIPFKKLLFSTCLFHAVLQERRKFGPLGWNIRYEYTTGDLNVCIKQLSNFLDKYDDVPYRVLTFLFGQINYGGRVTDDWDIRTLMTMIKSYIGDYVLKDGYKFSPSGMYRSIEVGDHASYIEYIRTLSINPSPEVFGLHENADITCAQAETKNMMDTLVSLQPKQSSAGGKSREEVIEEVSLDIQSRMPPIFDTETVMAKYPTKYEESMNTVLVQEVIRYNKLLKVMKKSLADILKALKGLVVMSSELEAVGTSLFNNQVPEMWADRAYPSLMPLASWIVDLIYRIDFIRSWYEEGIPAVYWISGFFFPQAFLTGTLQNYARKYAVSIDTVSFDFKIMDIDESDLPVPEDGCYIKGLYLEGARWDPVTKSLVESRPRELYTEVPVIWLRPVSNRKKPESGVYNCPMYKTLTRAGTLSTTGHSTNYVVTVEIPTNVDADHWIRRGVACFTALDYRL
eukprot:TRINITY_DN426_c0_g1_i1.p1 TRINITY_DN426_c0_g1~~TRINITY_DN426_c0_g1_i1.p1  ORF type:complete len:4140 (-),score=1088.60 TRINITY_DN426_c0_g1_i1:191-12610(-)